MVGDSLLRSKVLLVLFSLLLVVRPAVGQNIDGGRSELPGMRNDMFDQASRQKKMGSAGMGAQRGKAPPECPRSDLMSAFYGLAYVGTQDIYVKINSTEDQCQRLITIGGANVTSLFNASRTCGPVGEVKRRVVENTSSIFFQGGYEWVKSDGEMIEIVTEEGTFQVPVTEERYEKLMECWKRGCDCEQAKNPKGKAVLIAIGIIMLFGLGYDSILHLWKKFVGGRPPKHVECKKGHRLEEKGLVRTHSCDICSQSGTTYQCTANCNYDMCKTCYKAAKKKIKSDMKEWLEKHPEEKKKKKESSDNEDKDDDKDDDDDTTKDADSEADTKKGEKDADSEADTKKSEASGKSDDEDKEADKDERKEGTEAEPEAKEGKA